MNAAVALTVATGALAQDRSREGASYEVTITNLTQGQQFTLILAAGHVLNVNLFQLGQPARSELAALEESNVAPLTAALRANKAVLEVVNGNGLTDPGTITTLTANGREERALPASAWPPCCFPPTTLSSQSTASMAFTVPAHDAGNERNDEACAAIPGPNVGECGGSGGGAAPTGGEEGFVYISSGMLGVGSVAAAA